MAAIPDTPSSDTFESASRLANRLDVSPATIWRWAKQGRIPPGRKFGPNTTRFNVRETLAKLAT